jgi:hypothetical protein
MSWRTIFVSDARFHRFENETALIGVEAILPQPLEKKLFALRR